MVVVGVVGVVGVVDVAVGVMARMAMWMAVHVAVAMAGVVAMRMCGAGRRFAGMIAPRPPVLGGGPLPST